jgi:hypothetical protein
MIQVVDKRLIISLALTVTFLVMGIGIYTFAYLALGEWAEGKQRIRDFRAYEHRWQAIIFRPASKVESFLRKERVVTVWPASDEDLRSMSPEAYDDHIDAP